MPKPTQTMPEAVSRVLVHIERQAGRTNADAAYDGLLALPELPLDALAELGPLVRLDPPALLRRVPPRSGKGKRFRKEILPVAEAFCLLLPLHPLRFGEGPCEARREGCYDSMLWSVSKKRGK